MIYIILGVVLFLSLLSIPLICFIVPQQTVAVIERFGKFHKLSKAGLNFRIPLVDMIKDYVSTQITQVDVETSTKTSDNVTLEVLTSVQIKVAEENVFNAVYQLNEPIEQIKSYIHNIVRSKIPSMILDEVYENKNDIADDIENELTKQMSGFGFTIVKALVTDVKPDQRVLDAMNQINEQERLRSAAKSKAEAEKIIIVKKAEGESEAMRLVGEGIAKQRTAIINGLQESIEGFQKVMGSGVNPKEIMQIVITTQYYDTLKEIGANSKTNTLIVPHNSSGINSLTEQMISSNLLNKE